MTLLDDYLRRRGFDAPAHCNSVTKAITGLAGDDAIIEQMAQAAAKAVEHRYESPTPGYIVFDTVEDGMVTAVRAALRVLGEPR